MTSTTVARGFAAMQIAALLFSTGGATFLPLVANAAAVSQCDATFTSDVTTVDTTDSHPAVAVATPYNSRWTASIADATWIWSDEPTVNTVTGETKTFTKTFTITGTPTGATLDIAADDTYTVSVNGHSEGADSNPYNYQVDGQDVVTIPVADLLSGDNTLTITVTNLPQDGGTAASNPGGLLYKLAVNATCPPPPPANTCTFVSDADTQVDSHDAFVLSDTTVTPGIFNGMWTSIPGSSWIWSSDGSTTDTTVAETKSFTRTFTVTGTASSTLVLSSDNGYVVKVNGTTVDSKNTPADEQNFFTTHTYDVTSALVQGTNTLEVDVTNYALANSSFRDSNPGGLIYKLTVDAATCGDVPNTPPPPTNTCVAPTTLAQSGQRVIGNSPDGANSQLQTIMNTAGYSVDVDTDQTNNQAWTGSNNTVHFSAKFLSKFAGDKHVFGYMLNGGAFVPVFRDDASIGGVYASVPVNGTQNFDLSNVSDVVFAVVDVTTGKTYATKTVLDADGMQHAVVYNPSANTYALSFEDQEGANLGDHDYNDFTVEVKVNGCENQQQNTTATLVATKIVCPTEADLPNWGEGNGGDIGVNTAAVFLTSHPSCHAEAGWTFETAASGTANPGNNTEIGGADWTAFGPTDLTGVVSTTIPAGGYVWAREELQDGYIPFSGWVSNGSNTPHGDDATSAEMYCSTDHLNYDNYDRIDNIVAGDTYYCVAFNAPTTGNNGGNSGADVTITKTVGSVTDSATDIDTANAGDELVYTITAHNAGPDIATNVVVTDSLPAGVSYVDASAVTNTGTYAAGTWTIGSMANGDTAVLTFHVTVDGEAGDIIENTANITNDNDSNVDDNAGSASFTVNDDTTVHKNFSHGGHTVKGQVLGASCGLYMEKYLKFGSQKNDADQVTKLQIFLNTWMNSGLTVNGIFDQATLDAVNAFQTKYGDDILKPWGINGPTGLVYVSTLHEINMLECPALSLQLPPLVPWSQNPDAQ